jgi:hypothetical protein
MDGVDLIHEERCRQLQVEGYSAAHDDSVNGFAELVGAAMTYAGRALEIITDDEICGDEEFWPWDREQWKPSPNPIRNLVKAGALIAAEIDRLQREKAITRVDV